MRLTLKRIIHFIVFLFIALTVVSFPSFIHAETQVSISASDNLVFIGDMITVKIIVKTTDDIGEIKVNSKENPFDIVREFPTEKHRQNEYSVFEKKMTVMFFKVGEFNIGPFDIDLLKSGKVFLSKPTNSIPVTVKTTLKSEDKDIKPLKDLIEIKGNPVLIIGLGMLLIGLIIGIILLIWYLKRRKQRVPKPQAPPLSPLEELELHINKLWEKKLFETGKAKLHFIELTQLMKHFLSRQYGFNAEDLTTYETLYFLKQHEKDTALLDNMGYTFDTSDLVKFAKFEPDTPVMLRVFNTLKEVIEIYKRRLMASVVNAEEPR